MLKIQPSIQNRPIHSHFGQPSSRSAGSVPFAPRVDHSLANSAPITERFGKRLRELRVERDMTQTEMADFLGIDRSFISDVERGKKTMSLSYLETVAQGFRLTLAKLMEGL